jgi:ubiquinone/menaquinone biosynthesis C-methylase UbiE
VLEVGSGPGVFAARLVEELPGIALLATDQSHRFVELARERGLAAQVQDVQHLLAPDGAYDVAIAMWMLYHVPDLDRGLAEVRRVLRPGGLFVAVTNGDDHLADLMTEAGGTKLLTQFSRENGEAALRRHFDDVSTEHVDTRAVFEDQAAAVAYLASFDDQLAAQLPAFDGSREYGGRTTVFFAR